MRLLRPSRYTVANALLWTASCFIQGLRAAFLEDTPFPLQPWGRRFVIIIASFLLCQLALPLLRRMRGLPILVQGLAALLFAGAGAFFYGFMNYALVVWLSPFPAPPPSWVTLERAVPYIAFLQVWVFLAWCAIVLAISHDEVVQEQRLQLLSAEKLAAENQAAMLRYQLNPHFLFNTLNALSALILEKQNDRAERVVLSLSSFLRNTLTANCSGMRSLEEELEAQRQYLEIERIRFAERLVYEEAVPAELLQAKVPNLILQPLIENAVKYGVAPSTATVRIRIEAVAADGRLTISVLDDGGHAQRSTAPRLGVGLKNVRSRLELAYPGLGRLEVAPQLPKGFCAAIQLPWPAA